MNQPGMVANSTRSQLNRKNVRFPVPVPSESFVSRDGCGPPIPRQSVHSTKRKSVTVQVLFLIQSIVLRTVYVGLIYVRIYYAHNRTLRPCRACHSMLIASPQWGVNDYCHKTSDDTCQRRYTPLWSPLTFCALLSTSWLPFFWFESAYTASILFYSAFCSCNHTPSRSMARIYNALVDSRASFLVSPTPRPYSLPLTTGILSPL